MPLVWIFARLRCMLSLALVLVLATCCAPLPASAQVVESAATGTSGKSFRAEAKSRIPYERIEPKIARKIADVVDGATIYRQLPITTIQSDPDLYLTLLRYPEIIISTWQLMGVTQMTAQRVAPFAIESADGAGTTTRAELVYGDPELNIWYAEGAYDGPMLFRSVTGKCVIVCESRYVMDATGQPSVSSRMNVFLEIDNLAAGLIAKTIHPLVGTTADHNFVETLKFAEKLSQTTDRNGPGVQRMAERLQDVQLDVRQRFSEAVGIAWQRSLQRRQPAPVRQGTVQAGYAQQASGVRGR